MTPSYLLKAVVLSERRIGYGHRFSFDVELRSLPVVAALISDGSVDAKGRITEAGRAAARPPQLSRSQLKRRGLRIERTTAFREAIEAITPHGDATTAKRIIRLAGLHEECPYCLGLGFYPPGVAGVVGPCGALEWRLYPQVRHYDLCYPINRGRGWELVGWRTCSCRPMDVRRSTTTPERDPRVDPKPRDVVDGRTVVVVKDGLVGWYRPAYYGVRYLDGLWPLRSWRAATKKSAVMRYAEDWKIPSWLRPSLHKMSYDNPDLKEMMCRSTTS